MDCHEPSVLAMTKGDESSEFFSFLFLYWLSVVCGLLRFARNDEGGEWGFMDCFASLAMTVHTNSSLRELLATRGNLVILVSSLQRPKIYGNDNIKNKNHQIIWWNIFLIHLYNNIDILLKSYYFIKLLKFHNLKYL